jgi:hypothetical protein
MRRRLGWAYSKFNRISEAPAREAAGEREALLDAISATARGEFGGSKVCSGRLSPGCRVCGEGFGSCLFIGRICAQGCFLCPTNMDLERPPTVAWDVTFERPVSGVDSGQGTRG